MKWNKQIKLNRFRQKQHENSISKKRPQLLKKYPSSNFLQHPPCKMFAASILQNCCSLNPSKKSTLFQSVCSVHPIRCVQCSLWKIFTASTLQNVCSIHTTNILFLHNCNVILAFDPSNILLPIIFCTQTLQ